jgi:hypothetical protein
MAELTEQLWLCIKKAKNQKLYALFYSSPIREAVNITDDTSRDQHQRSTDWKRCPAGPGGLLLNRALHQSRHCRSQHSVCLFSQQRVTTATSRYSRTRPAGSTHRKRTVWHKPLQGDPSHQTLQTMTYSISLYNWTLNKYHIYWYRDFHFTTPHGTPYPETWWRWLGCRLPQYYDEVEKLLLPDIEYIWG